VKTEGTIRARFDKASSCSPCILILRHIDALAQTTQVLETGKGGPSLQTLNFATLKPQKKEPNIAAVIKECTTGLKKSWRSTGFPAVLFGTTSEPARVPMGLQSCFKHEINFEASCAFIHFRTSFGDFFRLLVNRRDTRSSVYCSQSSVWLPMCLCQRSRLRPQP
jgi:hypothetical protein